MIEPSSARVPQALIVSIGTEITNGAGLDTNSQWLSTELLSVGIATRAHLTLGDDLVDIAQTFATAAREVDLIIVSGGLGPTLDDLTREAMANAFGRELELHEESLERIRHLFASRNRIMPERNLVQAMFPVGSDVIPNPRGTAPGIWLETGLEGRHCRIAALPGVPSEMKPMFRDSVLPRIAAMTQGQAGSIIRRYRIACFGEGESAIEERLGDLTARGREPEVGITAHEATITLRIAARGSTAEECDRIADAVKQEIRMRLGDLVFGEEDQTLADVVAERLVARGERLAVLEFPLTGGAIATSLLSAVAATETNSSFFAGAMIMPSAAAAGELFPLNPHQKADLRGQCSQIGGKVRERLSAEWAIVAFGGTPELPLEQAVITLVGPDTEQHLSYRSFGDPAIDRARASKTALNLLRRELLLREAAVGPQ